MMRMPIIGIAICLIGGYLGSCGTFEADESSPSESTESDTSNSADGGPIESDGSGAACGVDWPVLSEMPASCQDDGDCSASATCLAVSDEDAGVCAATPSEAASITDPINAEGTGESPDLTCLDVEMLTDSEETVTLYGFVDRFGSGEVTLGLEVRVYDAAGFHPECCDATDVAGRDACYDAILGDEGIVLGKATSAAPDDIATIECEADADCPLGYTCAGTQGFEECGLAFGLYEITDVPADREVIVMTTSPNDTLGKWHDTFLFHTVFHSGFADAEGRYRYDPTIVGHGQWKTVPGPFFTSIKNGNGAIGGRIRDCQTSSPAGSSGDRRAWHIHEATVGFARVPSKIGYFNDKEEDSLPDASRTSTNILGRYAGLDVAPGPNWVAASALVDGEVVSLGAHRVYVFPDSLSIVSFPGVVSTITQE